MNTIVQRHQGVVTITLPIKTVSEANSHTHWRVRAKRAKAQRAAAKLSCAAPFAREGFVTEVFGMPLLAITMTRISPSAGLDSDNLPSSMKHLRDGVADALGVDDRDRRIVWSYAQERGPAKAYAVRIEVRQRGEVAA